MKKIILLLSSLVMAFLMSSCAQTEKMEASSIMPGARGEVKAEKGAHDNTDLAVEVEHLAPAENLAQGATNYIVWMQPEGTATFQNLGALKVNDDYEGSYTTTVPHKAFRILVTPEPGPTVASPTGPAVFDQFVRR